MYNVQFHKKSIPTPQGRSLETKLEIPRGGGFKPKKPSMRRGGMDIFWNLSTTMFVFYEELM